MAYRTQEDVEAHPRLWARVLSKLFGRPAMAETIATRVHMEVSPEAVWERIRFYEEVPGRPPLPLRAFIPYPVRTSGEKSSVGARILCTYHGGDLVKCMTILEPPRLIRFAVLEQRLGIEPCVVAQGGSYEIEPSGTGADVVLTTHYLAKLSPRWLWRPVERLVAGQLHHHVLNGMRGGNPADRREILLATIASTTLSPVPHEVPPARR